MLILFRLLGLQTTQPNIFSANVLLLSRIYKWECGSVPVCWWMKIEPSETILWNFSPHHTTNSSHIFGFAGVCSLCGNSMLLYVSYKKKHLLKPAEFFIINLAISDLGLTLSLYPLAVTSSLAHRYHKEIKL